MNQKGFLTLSDPELVEGESKGFAPILIVIIIAILVGGYLLYQNQPKPTPSPTTQLTSIPTPTLILTPESTNSAETTNPDLIGANWKTYTNTKYGLKFNYPQDWKTDGLDNFTSPNYQSNKEYNGGDFPKITVDKGAFLSIRFNEYTLPLTIDKYIEIESTPTTQNTTILLEKQKVLLKNWENINKYTEASFLRPYRDSQVIIKLYMMADKNESDAYNKTFNQILSTFRFD